MKVNLGGIVPLSTVDWPGRAAMVIFLRGCPLRCPYCHNHELQEGESLVEFSQIANEIKKTKSSCSASDQTTLEEAFSIAMTKPFASSIIISGGEPLMQSEQTKAIARLAKGLGLEVGIETSGYYPNQLSELLKKRLVDKVFLDIKAPLEDADYEIATGRKGVTARVLESLRICMKSGIPLSVRNTIFSEMPFLSGGSKIAKILSDLRAEFPENQLEVKVLQRGIHRTEQPFAKSHGKS
jgi:pyruvate formate lyase activating enzyme